MSKLKVLSLFSGIGAMEKALDNIKLNYDLVGFSEIDKPAIKSYTAIHNISEELNYGDISIVDTEKIPDFDLMTFGFPCQDLSKAGKLEGMKEDSKTRSSLLWETMKIARIKKPKYMIAENVRNLLSKKFKSDFDKWQNELNQLGYNTYYEILNARHYGIPQNRERVFVVSIRKDIDDGGLKFPDSFPLQTHLIDLMDTDVDDKYYLTEEAQNQLTVSRMESGLLIKNATTLGYLQANHGDGIDLAYPNSETRRGRVQKKRSQTLTTSDNLGVLIGQRIRKFTPIECFRLMGFSDEDFYKAQDVGVSDRSLYKQAGNSIVVNLLEEIFKELFKEKLIHNNTNTYDSFDYITYQ